MEPGQMRSTQHWCSKIDFDVVFLVLQTAHVLLHMNRFSNTAIGSRYLLSRHLSAKARGLDRHLRARDRFIQLQLYVIYLKGLTPVNKALM